MIITIQQITKRIRDKLSKLRQTKHICRTPCIMTPQQILDIIEAGYANQIEFELWEDKQNTSNNSAAIPLYRAKRNADGWCVFRKDNDCIINKLNNNFNFTGGDVLLSYKVQKTIRNIDIANEWINKDNIYLLKDIRYKLKKI